MKIETLPTQDLQEMRVHNLMIPGHKEWDIELIHEIFNERDISRITSIPLGMSNFEDLLIWHFTDNGCYTVKSGYHLACKVGLNEEAQVQGTWKTIWALKLPPKLAPICGLSFCKRLLAPCTTTKFNGKPSSECGIRQRNDKVWNGKSKDVPTMIRFAREYLYDWLGAKNFNCMIKEPQPGDKSCHMWHKPIRPFSKCNVDAAFFPTEQKIGLGCVVRKDDGSFFRARTCVVNGVADVKEGEAIGILEALLWVQSLGLKKVCFELDAKVVVEAINGSNIGVSEFSSIVRQCKNLIRSEQDFSIKFIRRQANECVHALAKASRSYASPMVCSEAPSLISPLLNFVCNESTHY
ncbi:uncharacterized protein [Henckelia pumila]|uniref:uncharacterized protein n=1 Tax=Henckelia pumila TaxID=405737 RepID=UPI003C6E2057